MKGETMNSKNFSIRIKSDVLEIIDDIAKRKEWSRNYVINKILTEAAYKLTRDD